jgi:O-antigen ligase
VYLVLANNNRNDEALMGAAYIMGFEVLARMTDAAFTYEFAKYTVIAFLVFGMFYKGFHRKSWPYIFFVFLLIPGIIFSAINLDYDSSVANAIGFNLSGPICLAISALYCYDRRMTPAKFQIILVCILLPLITNIIYLYFYTPDLRDSLTGTGSNYAASGGFGPNQVATILGLGMFILFTRLLTIENKLYNIVDFTLLGLITYRAVITFSRGGVFTAAICAVLFLFYYYRKLSVKKRSSLLPKIGIISGVLLITWVASVIFTSGLIVKRYSNEDAAGRLKDDITTGRSELIDSELDAFYENPITGIGIGKIREYRYEKTGILSATHNEMSRMLSEHGVFGLFALIILFVAPLVLRIKNRSNFYLFSLLAFWFLTINHSSMRIAAPALVYGLCLITLIDAKKKPALHRK